jgi:hypothetical protein
MSLNVSSLIERHFLEVIYDDKHLLGIERAESEHLLDEFERRLSRTRALAADRLVEVLRAVDRRLDEPTLHPWAVDSVLDIRPILFAISRESLAERVVVGDEGPPEFLRFVVQITRRGVVVTAQVPRYEIVHSRRVFQLKRPAAKVDPSPEASIPTFLTVHALPNPSTDEMLSGQRSSARDRT